MKDCFPPLPVLSKNSPTELSCLPEPRSPASAIHTAPASELANVLRRLRAGCGPTSLRASAPISMDNRSSPPVNANYKAQEGHFPFPAQMLFSLLRSRAPCSTRAPVWAGTCVFLPTCRVAKLLDPQISYTATHRQKGTPSPGRDWGHRFHSPGRMGSACLWTLGHGSEG